MTPSEAAKVIGCNPRYVRTLIQQDKLSAQLIWKTDLSCEYDIKLSEVRRYAKTKQSRGWPRGKPRKSKKK
jgi:hypothetical protein